MTLIDSISEFDVNVKELIRQVCGELCDDSNVEVVDPVDVCKNINDSSTESTESFKIDFNSCANYIKWTFYCRVFVSIRLLTVMNIVDKLHSTRTDFPSFKCLEHVFGKNIFDAIGYGVDFNDFQDLIKRCSNGNVDASISSFISVVNEYNLKVFSINSINDLKVQIEQFNTSDAASYMTCEKVLNELVHNYELGHEPSHEPTTNLLYKNYTSTILKGYTPSFMCCNGREQTVNLSDVPFNIDFITRLLTDCENEYIESYRKVFGKDPPNDYYILAVFVTYFKEVLPRYRIDDIMLYRICNYNLSEVVNKCIKKSIVDPERITFAKLINLYVSTDKAKLYKMKVMLASLLISYFKHEQDESLDLEIVEHCKSIYTYLLYGDKYRDILDVKSFDGNSVDGNSVDGNSDYIDDFDFNDDDFGMTGGEHFTNDNYSRITSEECKKTLIGFANTLHLQVTDVNSYDNTSITINDIIHQICDYSTKLCTFMNRSNRYKRLSDVETVLSRSTNVGKFTEVIFAIDLPNTITKEIKEMFSYYLEAINEFSHLLKNIQATVNIKIVLPNHNVRIGVMRTITRLLSSASHFVGQDDDDCSVSMENITELALTEFTSNPNLMILDYEICSGAGYVHHANQLCSRVMNSRFMSLLGLYTTTWYSNLDDGIFSGVVKTIQLLHYAISCDKTINVVAEGKVEGDDSTSNIANDSANVTKLVNKSTFYKLCDGVLYYFLEPSKSCIDSVNGYPSEGELLLYQSRILGLPLNTDLMTTYVLCKTFIMVHLNRRLFNINSSLYPENYCDAETIKLGISFSNSDELHNKLQYPSDYVHFFAVIDYFAYVNSELDHEPSYEPKRKCKIFGYFGTIRPDRNVKVIMNSGQFYVVGRIDDIEHGRDNMLGINDFNKLTMQKPYKMFGSNETFRMSIRRWNELLTGGEYSTIGDVKVTDPLTSTERKSPLFKLFVTFLLMLSIIIIVILLTSLIINKCKNNSIRII